MAKVIIVSHHTEATQLLEALQREGICQILNAQEAMVSKDMPELTAAAERPKDIEGLLNWLQNSIVFLKNYAQAKKGLASVLSPRTVIDNQSYNAVISQSQEILKIVGQAELTKAAIEIAKSEIENLNATLQMLEPFKASKLP